MDTSRDKPMGTEGNPYIWLRYTTQFSSGGRTHTIEMGIPVPLGASAEVREQLIREAEIGMEQLSRHVENRVSQVLQQRNPRPPETVRAQESSTARPAQTPLQDAANRSAATRSTTPASSPGPVQQASQAPAREEPLPLPLHEKQPSASPIRQSVAANMPVTLGVQGDASSNMKLSQFMQVIRETWGLTPKQAMDLLNVKTLNGMNYREALRQLQPLVEGDARNAMTPAKNPPAVGQARPASSNAPPSSPIPLTGTAQGTQTRAGATHSAQPTPAPQAAIPSKPVSPTPPVRPAPGALAGPANIPVIPLKEGMLHEVPRVYKFDEEEEEKDEENEAQRAIARMKLDELKEVRGTSSASPGRLMALQNVLNSQITEEQLQRLIQSAWGATSAKKLKVDQVEALIAWAKEDYFVDEVEEVLALIDAEESYARSDW